MITTLPNFEGFSFLQPPLEYSLEHQELLERSHAARQAAHLVLERATYLQRIFNSPRE